ncbi:hypothetical protein [Mucilaginibacter flavus]|nr:hypothetical protein [Mucilaginibacter flavus]MDN3580083.1 hypothetical protein [Mucilaginibacter flavus]
MPHSGCLFVEKVIHANLPHSGYLFVEKDYPRKLCRIAATCL